MPEARPEAGQDTGADEPLSADALDVDGLRTRGDVEGLLTLAKAYRNGTAPGGRDMKRCLEVYRVASDLGSADAEYAVALFHMSGGVTKQDLKEGATRLRAAAEKGSVPAKVYLGNLYELGIHYKADPEKADVWYRNAARGARVDAAPGSPEYVRDLADLGCVRHVLALVGSPETTEDDKRRLLQRARAHGHGLRIKDEEAALDRPATARPGPDTDPRSPLNVSLEALQETSVHAAPVPTLRQPVTTKAREPEEREAPPAEAKPAKTKPRSVTASGPSRASIALGAFGYALLFAITGVGAAYAATLGAREVVAHGTLLPLLGARAHLVFPITLALVGVLPSWLVYRLGTVVKALAIGAFFATIGWIAWGTGQAAVHTLRQVQAMTFGLAGFLAALLVLGILGGTKRQPKTARHPTG